MINLNDIHVSKILITCINILILLALPISCGWHISRVRLFQTWEYEWWVQIMIIFAYVAAINAEIPALWSRIRAYYVYRIQMPDDMYVLTTWDRWGHVLFYIVFILLTYVVSTKHVPKIITHSIG